MSRPITFLTLFAILATQACGPASEASNKGVDVSILARTNEHVCIYSSPTISPPGTVQRFILANDGRSCYDGDQVRIFTLDGGLGRCPNAPEGYSVARFVPDRADQIYSTCTSYNLAARSDSSTYVVGPRSAEPSPEYYRFLERIIDPAYISGMPLISHGSDGDVVCIVLDGRYSLIDWLDSASIGVPEDAIINESEDCGQADVRLE